VGRVRFRTLAEALCSVQAIGGAGHRVDPFRAAEEMAEATVHRDDITAGQHRRLAKEHLALAREAEKAARDGDDGKETPPLMPEAGRQ